MSRTHDGFGPYVYCVICGSRTGNDYLCKECRDHPDSNQDLSLMKPLEPRPKVVSAPGKSTGGKPC